ncbi:hypothetical protein JTB14_032182, partial [Gonioctena quinquepunctata]
AQPHIEALIPAGPIADVVLAFVEDSTLPSPSTVKETELPTLPLSVKKGGAKSGETNEKQREIEAQRTQDPDGTPPPAMSESIPTLPPVLQ